MGARSFDAGVTDGIEGAVKGFADLLREVEPLVREQVEAKFAGSPEQLMKAFDGLTEQANALQGLQANLLAREKLVFKAEAHLDRDLAPQPVSS